MAILYKKCIYLNDPQVCGFQHILTVSLLSFHDFLRRVSHLMLGSSLNLVSKVAL